MPTYKIAIVGAGPAGYFTAQALQKAQTEELVFAIDMIERLPTPWGLVRSGVAPDHPKIKTVSKVFEKIAKEPNFRLFANVELGKDISLKDLRDQYDAVVLATGASRGRKLGIPGEDLTNSLSAADFVPWYNSHPDYVNTEVDLSSDTAVVIGAGNVAMDVARILAIDPTELDPTDVADHALVKLKQSNIRTVIICGRRGPEHAAFTAPELRDLPKLENTDVYIDSKQIQDAESRIAALSEIEKDLKNNLEAMRLIADHSKKGVERKLEIKFLAAPIEFKGNNKIEEVVFAQNKVEKLIQKSEDQCDLVSLLFKSTLKFDQGKIEKIIRKSISDIGVEQTWVEVISPLLILVGDEWVRTGTGIEIEHFLSEVLRKILSENLGTISRPKNSRPVLLACVENEMHSLALLVLAAVLAEARIECIFLGARTPQSALNQVIIKSAPPAIFLWAQLSENADHKYVKSMPSIRPAPRVLLGGPGWKTSKVAASNKLVMTEGLRDAREQIIEALAV